jgi:hypothetical protein
MQITPRRMRALTAFTCLAVCASPAMSWGPEGHLEIGEKAIESLRDPLKEFFEDREETFYELLDDPARSRNTAHFFLERYDEFPFWDVPASRELALRRFSEDEIRDNGDALWRLQEAYDALVAAFEEADFDLVLERASDVAWLVGELSVPPNTSASGDGQATQQDGLARRFDTQLLEVFADEMRVRDSAGVFLDRPHEFIRSLPLKAHIWVDNVTFTDSMSRRGVAGYDRFYMDGMWNELGGLIGALMTDAARDTASLWYTAWVAAGRPEVPET